MTSQRTIYTTAHTFLSVTVNKQKREKKKCFSHFCRVRVDDTCVFFCEITLMRRNIEYIYTWNAKRGTLFPETYNTA